MTRRSAPFFRRATLLVALAVIPATVVTAPRSAAAQPVDEAQGKEYAKEAMTHYKASEFEDALVKFKQARAIYPTGQVLRMTGYTLIALEQWVDAAQTLREALDTDLKPLLPRDAEHAEDQLALALTHVAAVEVTSSIDGATLSVDDGEERALPATIYLSGGAHRFIVTAPGHAPVEREQDLTVGEKVRLELDPTAVEPEPAEPIEQPKPKPKPPPEPEEPTDLFGWFPGQGIAGLATAGVGVLFTGVAIGTGIYGGTLRSAVRDNIATHYSVYDANCTTNTNLCLADRQGINRDGERAQTYQNVAIGTGITGGALIAVGATLFLFSDMSPLAPADGGGPDSVSLACAPGVMGLGCYGTF